MLQLLILFILILCNAFFAAAEIAFISLNDAKVAKMGKEGNKKASKISKMLKEPSKFLATLQIGVTFAGFLSSAFAATSFAGNLAPMLNSLLPVNMEFWTTVSIILITIILSYFTLIFGELVPKRLAMKNYEKIAFASVGIIRGIYIFTSPFVKLLTMSTNFITKLFGVSEKDEETVTEEEIRIMIDVGEEKGTIEEQEKEMINNIFEFNDKTVNEIMIHRTDVFGIDINSDINKIIDVLDEYKYSRIPVYDETIDNIEGILYIKDLIKVLRGNKTIKLKNIIREAYFVPENKKLNELFKELQKNKNQMAIVVDEYGGTAGIATMEDILEEIVGNIFDEYDDVENDFEKIDENTYRISGSVSMYDLEKILDLKFEDGDYDTLSGYLIDLMGRIPEDEETPVIETERVTYKIEEYEDKRILWVKACKNKIHDVEDEELLEEDK